MQHIQELVEKKQRTERVIQFGEGGFLRGFADWMLQKLNVDGRWEGSVVIVQPLQKGMCGRLMEQNGICATFHIFVKYRQNATWQGILAWKEGHQEMEFCSVLELIIEMDAILGRK